MRDESGQFPGPVARCGTQPGLADELKLVEERIQAMIDGIERDRTIEADPHGLAIARAHVELAFLELFQAIGKAGAVETGWVLERGDSDPDQPLYFAPEGGHGRMWSHESEDALLLVREIDASRLAMTLGVECRVAEILFGELE